MSKIELDRPDPRDRPFQGGHGAAPATDAPGLVLIQCGDTWMRLSPAEARHFAARIADVADRAEVEES